MNYMVEFIVFPCVLGLDIAGPLEVFNTAAALMYQKQKQKSVYKARFTAARKGPVRLSSGLKIVADTAFSDATDADILLVPGGSNIRCVVNDTEYMNYIRRRSKQVKRIISVYGGLESPHHNIACIP